LHDPLPFRSRLAQDKLGLPLRLLPDLRPELLRRDQRVVQRLVALAKDAKLLVEPPRPRLEILTLAREPLKLLGDLVPEILDALRIVAAKPPGTEVPPAHVERGQVKGFVAHVALAPN